MSDRIVTKPYFSKNDLRLQALVTSPYAQQQLQIANLLNYRGQVIAPEDYIHDLYRRKRQRREHETGAQDIIFRALKMDRDTQRSRRNRIEMKAKQTINANFEALDKRHSGQISSRKKSREKSVPGNLVKVENNDEKPVRVTSAHSKKPKIKTSLAESEREQSRVEPVCQLRVSSEKRRVCEIIMSYGSKPATNNEKPVRHETVVVQQHTSGENVVVYRGFLAQGESFAFQTQRRPGSPLSLAFYAKGFIDSVVNDCCEYKFGKNHPSINEHSQFSVERIEKATACQNCRRKSARKTQLPNTSNNKTSSNLVASSLQRQTERSQKADDHLITSILKLPVANRDPDSSERSVSLTREQEEEQKIKKHKNRRVTVNIVDEKENKDKQIAKEQKSRRVSAECSSSQGITEDKSASVDFGLLEYTLLQDRKPLKPKNPKKSSYRSILKNSSTRNNADTSTKEKTFVMFSQTSEDDQACVN